jgi:hypothetical protein
MADDIPAISPPTGKRRGWVGFNGRVFLDEHEHATYCRRLPVRYAAKSLGPKPDRCQISFFAFCHLKKATALPGSLALVDTSRPARRACACARARRHNFPENTPAASIP